MRKKKKKIIASKVSCSRKRRVVAFTRVVGAPSMACDALSELVHCDRRHFYLFLFFDLILKFARNGIEGVERKKGKMWRDLRRLKKSDPKRERNSTGIVVLFLYSKDTCFARDNSLRFY